MAVKAYIGAQWARFCTCVQAAHDRLPPPHTLSTWVRRPMVVVFYPPIAVLLFAAMVCLSAWYAVRDTVEAGIDVWTGNPPR